MCSNQGNSSCGLVSVSPTGEDSPLWLDNIEAAVSFFPLSGTKTPGHFPSCHLCVLMRGLEPQRLDIMHRLYYGFDFTYTHTHTIPFVEILQKGDLAPL